MPVHPVRGPASGLLSLPDENDRGRLAAPGSRAVLQDSTKGLPLTLNGANVSVTVNAQAPIEAPTIRSELLK
jgi:hypothetical protein